MMQKAIKLISLVMASVMVVILFSAAPSTAASKKPKLISSVEMQKYDKATKKWETTSRTEYKYNKKGDPIQIDWTSYTGWGYSTKTIDYHYRKNGKRKYATFKGTGREWDSFGGEYSNYTDKGKITYNKYGHRTKEKYKHSTKRDNGAGGSIYVTDKCKHKKYLFYLDGIDLSDHAKTKISTYKKGILKKIKIKYEDSKWRTRFTFLKKGLLKKALDSKYKYTYYKGTGLVKTIRDSSEPNERRVIKYSKKSMGKMRYNAMINSLVESNNFIWY